MKLALFGSPAKHSLSPAMHRAALAATAIDGDYVAREVDLDGFLAGIGELRRGGLDGANITMPYKRTALEEVDELNETAERVGAVNTIAVTSGSLVGDNTDVLGVLAAFGVAGLPEMDPVVVLGAGGAAAAALVALAGRRQYIVARDLGKARDIVARVGAAAETVAWGDPVPAAVVINATSLGMQGESLPEEYTASATGLLDMPYRNEPTPSALLLRKRGLPVADGLDMLVGQAVASFEIWTGRTVGVEVLRNAAEQELLKRARSATSTRR
ncbi:MAG: shikimate dehydrogenase [Acidimicrobiia bacterium]|nr:shikimate dehydrogenase [Acidimicrobiia bacterium]